MCEKLLAPSGIAKRVNYCMEQKVFVIMQASRKASFRVNTLVDMFI